MKEKEGSTRIQFKDFKSSDDLKTTIRQKLDQGCNIGGQMKGIFLRQIIICCCVIIAASFIYCDQGSAQVVKSDNFVDVGTHKLRVVLSDIGSEYTIILEAGGEFMDNRIRLRLPAYFPPGNYVYQTIAIDESSGERYSDELQIVKSPK